MALSDRRKSLSDAALAADAPAGALSFGVVPKGERMMERFTAPDGEMPWLPEAELGRYVADFERTGVTGGLNRYRNIDRDWADLAAWHHAPITQPALFIGGEFDGPTAWQAHSIANFAGTLPGVMGAHILDGCGHWVQQERPDEVNQLLTSWLDALPRKATLL